MPHSQCPNAGKGGAASPLPPCGGDGRQVRGGLSSFLIALTIALLPQAAAAQTGPAPGPVADLVSMSETELKARNITTITLGDVILPTGRIVAADPLVQPDRPPFVVTVPPGRYPVTLLEHGDGIAAAILRFPGGPVYRWQLAVTAGQDIKTLKADEIFGIPVDAGLASYMDATTYALIQQREAQARAEKGAKYSEYYSDVLAGELTANGDRYVMHQPIADKPGNVAIFQAGWGDGFYAVYWGLDSKGTPVALMTDFQTYTGPEKKEEAK